MGGDIGLYDHVSGFTRQLEDAKTSIGSFYFFLPLFFFHGQHNLYDLASFTLVHRLPVP